MPSHQHSRDHIIALLSGISLFSGLETELLAELADVGEVLRLPAKRRLFGSGEPIEAAHLLVSGSIKRSTLLADAVEKVLELVRPGQLVAMSEVFGTTTYASSAQAVHPSTLIAIPVARLTEIAGHHPSLSLRLLTTIARQHHAAEFEVISHHALPGAQRVLDYLLHLAGDRRDIAGETTVELDASKKLIAARLDMTPETFSRMLRQLSSDGMIVVHGRYIHIQNATLTKGGTGAEQRRRAPLHYSRTEQMAKNRRRPSPAALVNLCGRHRMLSQRMATYWCINARKIVTGPTRGALRKYREQFERNLAQVGALIQSLAPELHRKIDLLGGLWTGYRDLLCSHPPASVDPDAVFDLSEHILDAADALTAAAARAAGTTEARCVNIAGRNRMLTARIAKLFLFQDWGVRRTEARKLMTAARREFDANIATLTGCGGESPEIAAQLIIDVEQWRALTSIIDSPARFGMADGHAREVLAASDELLRHLDTTVKLYERLAERKSAAGTAVVPS